MVQQGLSSSSAGIYAGTRPSFTNCSCTEWGRRTRCSSGSLDQTKDVGLPARAAAKETAASPAAVSSQPAAGCDTQALDTVQMICIHRHSPSRTSHEPPLQTLSHCDHPNFATRKRRDKPQEKKHTSINTGRPCLSCPDVPSMAACLGYLFVKHPPPTLRPHTHNNVSMAAPSTAQRANLPVVLVASVASRSSAAVSGSSLVSHYPGNERIEAAWNIVKVSEYKTCQPPVSISLTQSQRVWCCVLSCLGASRCETASKPSLVSTEIEAVIGSWGSALFLEPPGHGVSIFTKGGLGGDDDDINRKCATGSLTMREGLDGHPAGTPGGRGAT